jgi:hypothetical protein
MGVESLLRLAHCDADSNEIRASKIHLSAAVQDRLADVSIWIFEHTRPLKLHVSPPLRADSVS